MNQHKSKKLYIRILLITAPIIIGIFLGLWQVKPPALPKEGSADYLAYQRMMSNVQELAAKPHPSGSMEIELVRAKLIAEIEGMGLTPIIQNIEYTVSDIIDTAVITNGYSSREEMMEDNRVWIEKYYPGVNSLEEFFRISMPDVEDVLHLQNILVKLEAPEAKNGIMFVAHYDSVPQGPGAADAMVAVCAMLEAMRIHSQNEALENDIYFLFTDGEELGLLGAWAFVEAFAELKEHIDMVINLEARGNSGGLILFETSVNAYPLMRMVVNSGARVIGFSWAVEIYRMMPNDTDLTAFLRNGYNGINFAVVGGVEHYHQPTDSFENLDRASAWHYLQTTLALSAYAANNTMRELRDLPSEAVYFPFLPGTLVLMDSMTSFSINILICSIAILYIIFQRRKGTLRLSFSVVLIRIFLFLSILCTVFFASASYIFYIPLLCVTVSALLERWKNAQIAARMLSGIIFLIVWVPIVYTLWVSLIQPMML